MQRARVIGRAVATTKHPSLKGFRLMVAQPLTGDDRPDGDPLIVIDVMGTAVGSVALISSDGKSARELLGSRNSPVRYTTLGVEDE